MDAGRTEIVGASPATVINRAERAVRDQQMSVIQEKRVGSDGWSIIASRESFGGILRPELSTSEFVRIAIFPAGEGRSRMTVLSEVRGQLPPWKAALDAELINQVTSPEARQARIEADDRERRAKRLEEAEWNRLPAQERARARQWAEAFRLYIRAGYEIDEAEVMADRMSGGRPAHLPPR